MMRTLKTKTGEIQQLWYGSVICFRYVGTFHNPNLQSMSDTGMWYTKISGNPHAIQGEGETPEKAIDDSIVRTRSRTHEMQQGMLALQFANLL
jgi:hypothetical protein